MEQDAIPGTLSASVRLTDAHRNLQVEQQKLEKYKLKKPEEVIRTIYGEDITKISDVNRIEYLNDPLLRSAERMNLMKEIIQEIGNRTNALASHKDLGIFDYLQSSVPDQGTLYNGGDYPARFRWMAPLKWIRGGYSFNHDRESKEPNINIVGKPPSPTLVITFLAMTGSLPPSLDAFTEEVCHAAQFRKGWPGIPSRLALEGQVKRLHTNRVAEDGNGNYTLQSFGPLDRIASDVEDYVYRRESSNILEGIQSIGSGIRNRQFDCLIKAPVDVFYGRIRNRRVHEKTMYLLESYDILRAFGINELVLADLAARPGKWKKGAYQNVKSIVAEWTKGYTPDQVKDKVEQSLQKKQIDQQKTIAIAQKAITEFTWNS